MLGWDVGYVWPLLEGVVTSPQSVVFAMGCPSRTEPDSSTSTTNRSSLSNNNNSNPANVSPRDRAPHPPPYESIAGSAASTSSTASGSNSPTSPRAGSRPSRRHAGRRNTDSSDTSHDAVPEVRPLGGRLPRWPHKASSTFACLSCVLGLYNISRFSVLVYIYKGSFIVQFLLLSMIIGIPLLYLLMVLGQYLGAGLLDMWYISPAFKGLGFAMLYIYVILGVYNAVPLSWLFVYFKDSFITLKDSYKWGRCHYNFARNDCLKALNSSAADYYGWSVPSYFHGRVLGRRSGEFQFGELKFEVAFNLCLVWLIIFICLSRGPKTLGKVLYIMGTLPVILLIMITMRMGQQWGQGVKDIFASPWKPVMLDSNAWLVAAREVFLTWGLMGCVTLHICSHNKISTNVTKTLAAVAFVTIVVLILSSFLFSCAANVLSIRNLSFASSSFEEEASVRVLKSGISSSKNLSVSIMIIGESIISREKFAHLSGYQVLRLATEAFPAALAVEGVRSISSFWSICFYTAMIMFGLGQQAVLWFCVIESVISINYKVFKAWHTTLTFITCNLAFLLGLPLTSNVGIYIIYYFDFCVGMLWWIIVIYLIMLFAVLFIRGRPCGTDQLVKMVCRRPSARSWVLPILTFQWNILLPVALLVLTIGFLRSSSMNPSSVSGWMKENYNYWPEWAKTLMFCIQVFPLMITMTTFLFQVFKVFILKVDLPLTERLRYLCCPVLPPPSANSHHSLHSTSSLDQGSTNSAFVDDPPPKYTPPPSYSTATSRMLAKRFQLPPAMECSIDLDALENEQEDQKMFVSALSPRRDNSVLRVTELRSDSNMTAQVT